MFISSRERPTLKLYISEYFCTFYMYICIDTGILAGYLIFYIVLYVGVSTETLVLKLGIYEFLSLEMRNRCGCIGQIL